MKEDQKSVKIHLYIVRETKSADYVTCNVPCKVNSDIIYFGPCMIKLREKYFKECLKNSESGMEDLSELIYFIGLSGSKVPNAKKNKVRKIVWVGKLLKALTFEGMYNYIYTLEDKDLKNDFLLMTQQKCSPLHIKPIYKDNGRFKGYKLRSLKHINWIKDITSFNNTSDIAIEENIEIEEDFLKDIKVKALIIKKNADRKKVLNRDCCFLFKNIFFAKGQGIEIDGKVLSILKKVQPLKKDKITKYYIFGKNKDGSATGLRGKGLLITSNNAHDFIELLFKKINSLSSYPANQEDLMVSRSKCN